MLLTKRPVPTLVHCYMAAGLPLPAGYYKQCSPPRDPARTSSISFTSRWKCMCCPGTMSSSLPTVSLACSTSLHGGAVQTSGASQLCHNPEGAAGKLLLYTSWECHYDLPSKPQGGIQESWWPLHLGGKGEILTPSITLVSSFLQKWT